MDTGKRKVDTKFYKGYEGESEVIISTQDTEYHFWEGYFEDIFGNPLKAGDTWKGFTRDYNEMINSFDDTHIECVLPPEEYLQDLKLYLGNDFSYEETSDVLDCLIAILEDAEQAKKSILIRAN